MAFTRTSGAYFTGDTPISFGEIRRIFAENENSQISASQIYRNTDLTNENPIVPDAIQNEGIPTSGRISLSNFRNSIKELVIEQTSTDIAANTTDIQGWNGGANRSKNIRKNLVIKGVVGSNNSNTPALYHNSSAFVNLSIIVDVDGKVYGAGGLGGSSNSGNGTNGGSAIKSDYNVKIINRGQLWAGGGGGGGGGKGGTGGKGGDGAYQTLIPQTCITPDTTEPLIKTFTSSYEVNDIYPDTPENPGSNIHNLFATSPYITVDANIDPVAGGCREPGSRRYTHTVNTSTSFPEGGTYVEDSFKIFTPFISISRTSASGLTYPDPMRVEVDKITSNSYQVQFFTVNDSRSPVIGCNSFNRRYILNYEFKYRVDVPVPGQEFDCSFLQTINTIGGDGGVGGNGGTGGAGRGYNYQVGALTSNTGSSGSPGEEGGINSGDGGVGGTGGAGGAGGDWGSPGNNGASGFQGFTGNNGVNINNVQVPGTPGASGIIGGTPGAPGKAVEGSPVNIRFRNQSTGVVRGNVEATFF